MIIAIDTATETASVAITHSEGGIAAELTWKAGRNHTMHVHPTLRHRDDCWREPRRTDLIGRRGHARAGEFHRDSDRACDGQGPGTGARCTDCRGGDTRQQQHMGRFILGRPVWSVVNAGSADSIPPRPMWSLERCMTELTQLVEEAILSPEELVSRMAERGEDCVLTGEFDEALGGLGAGWPRASADNRAGCCADKDGGERGVAGSVAPEVGRR